MTTANIIYRTARTAYLVDLDDTTTPVRAWDSVAGHYTVTIDVAPSTRRKVLAAARKLVAGKCDESHELHYA